MMHWKAAEKAIAALHNRPYFRHIPPMFTPALGGTSNPIMGGGLINTYHPGCYI